MSFELAYDLQVAVGHEVILVRSDDRQRKVRVEITELDSSEDRLSFAGRSIGSSYREIKAAKKEESPILVRGELALVDGKWCGNVEMVK
jgi:hypothetical protein